MAQQDSPQELDAAEPETVCSICHAEFLDAQDLKLHVAQLHFNDVSLRRYCHFCTAFFSDIEDYACHLRDEHITTLLGCKYCTRVFQDQGTLSTHLIKHEISANSKLFSCSHCSNLFDTDYDLEQHEYKDHSDSPEGVLLNDCFSILTSVLNMKAPTFLRHLGSGNIYTCAQCEYETVDLLEYVKHLRVQNCRAFACDSCCNVYKYRKVLSRHLRVNKRCCNYVNQEELMRKCRICKQKMPALTYNEHIKMCNRIKCRVCNLMVASIQELQTHQTMKHPKAILMTTCKFCRREFVGTVALERHMTRIHKPQLHLYKYMCVHCTDRYFMHPKHLFAHFFSKHGDFNPYSCRICDVSFKIRKKFTIHIKMVHDSKGYVEFDENYYVSFSETKSPNAFQPTSLFTSEIDHIDAANSQTEAETDVQTDRETDKPKVGKKPLKLRMKKEKIKDANCTETEIENQSEIEKMETEEAGLKEPATEQEATETEVEGQKEKENSKGKKVKGNLKRKRTNLSKSFKKSELMSNINDLIGNSDVSSEDEPLVKVKKRQKLKHLIRNGPNTVPGRKSNKNHLNKAKFTCTICKKYCYTFQNYHHHISLHFKDEAKKCIKCQQEFSSRAALIRHIQAEHKTSRLTETLRSMLERRKAGNKMSPLSNTEKFQRTIKKVHVIPDTVVAKLTQVQDKLNVKNFLETFTPDEGVEKAKMASVEVTHSVSFTPVDRPVNRLPVIKMTKFVSKPVDPYISKKLALPVRFKETPTEKHKVTVKLINANGIDNGDRGVDNDFDYNDGTDHYEEIVENQDKSDVPDVAQEQEVTAVDTASKPYNIPHTLVLPKDYLHNTSKIRIAHMLPEKPFYKIIKMEDVLEPKKETVEPKEVNANPTPIELPDGTKLVNVNPLAHLIGDMNVEELIGPAQKKYYKSKANNRNNDVQTAIAKALQKLDSKRIEVAAKRAKKNVVCEQ